MNALPRPIRVTLALLVMTGWWTAYVARLAVAVPVCVWIVALQVAGDGITFLIMRVVDVAAALVGGPPARVLAAAASRHLAATRARLTPGVAA